MKDDRFSLNVRFLAILIGSVFLIGIVFFFVHRSQIKRQSHVFLNHARTIAKNNKEQEDFDVKLEQVRKASSEYQKYLRSAPDNRDVMAEYGLMLVDEAEEFAEAKRVYDAVALYREGLLCLEKVLREEPDRRKLRRSLVDSLSALGKANDAIKHIAMLATIPKNAEQLRELFDRYDLWQRAAVGSVGDDDGKNAVLNRFLVPETDAVDAGKLTDFLQDDLWMILEDPELLSIFGKCQIQLDRPELAEKPLKKSIQLAPAELDTYRTLADLLRQLGNPEDADYWMSESVSANPNDFSAIRRRGEYRIALIKSVSKSQAVHLANQAFSDAITSILKTLEQAGDKADASSPSSSLTKKYKMSLDALRKVKPWGDKPPVPEFSNRLVAAVQALKSLSEGVPETRADLEEVQHGLVLAARCELALSTLESDKASDPHVQSAKSYGQLVVELFPGNDQAYTILSHVERKLGNDDKAIQWLRQGSQFKEIRSVVLWQLAQLLIDTDNLEEAKKTIDTLSEEGVSNTFIKHLKAMVSFREKKWAEAKAGFEEVLPYMNEWPESALQLNVMIAKCCEELGLVDQQREALMRASSLDITSVDVLLNLANLESASGRLDEAIEDYRLVLRLRNAPPDAYLGLCRVLLVKNLRLPLVERNWHEFESAFKEAKAVLGNDSRLSILRADMLAGRGKIKEATQLLNDTREYLLQQLPQMAIQIDDLNKKIDMLSGEERRKSQKKVNMLLDRAHLYQDLQPMVWQSLVNLAEQQHDWSEAKRLISAAEAETGDSPQLRLLKARNYALRYGKESLPQIKELLENTESFSPAQKQWLWQHFAKLAYDLHDYQTANELCKRVIEAEDDNLEVYRLLLQIGMAQKDIALIKSTLNAIEKIEGAPSAYWRFGEAMRLMLLVEQGGSKKLLQRALDQLDIASRLDPHWGQISLLAGMIHEEMGNDDAAIDSYLLAIDQGAIQVSAIHRAAQLLIKNNRLRDADRMFRTLAERKPALEEEISREKRTVKSKLGEFESAIAPAKKIAESSGSYQDYIWLGQLCNVVSQEKRAQGKNDDADELLKQAEGAFRQAILMKSDATDPWVTLIQFYAQNKMNAKAEEAIDRAKMNLPETIAAATLAQCYEILNQPKKAAAQYRAALNMAPGSATVAENVANYYYRTNRIADAKAQLMRIIERKVDASKQQVMQARRRLALILSEQGDQQSRNEAMQWIEKNLAEAPKSSMDQYLKAVIMANDLSGKHNQEAIASLEKLLASQSSQHPQIQFALAQLYLADGNWPAFKTRMEKLLRNHRDVPQYVATYAVELLERKDFPDSELMAAQLVKIAPDDVRTVAIRSELSFMQKQYKRTRQVLFDYLNASNGKVAEKQRRILTVANAFVDFALRLQDENQDTWAKKYMKDANQLYQQYVDAVPGREMLMASFLAKQRRLDEAIDLIDSLWETATPKMIAHMCFEVIDEKGASSLQVGRIEKILNKAAKHHPKALVLQIAIAVVYNMQGRMEDAEEIYRNILRQSPDNPTALNNLAVLLAQNGVKLNEAANLIDRAIETAGSSGDLLDSRAVVQLALNHPEIALHDLHKAIAHNPTASRYFHQAQAYFAIGQRKAARESLKKAFKLGLREENLRGVELRKYKKLKVLLQ